MISGRKEQAKGPKPLDDDDVDDGNFSNKYENTIG